MPVALVKEKLFWTSTKCHLSLVRKYASPKLPINLTAVLPNSHQMASNSCGWEQWTCGAELSHPAMTGHVKPPWEIILTVVLLTWMPMVCSASFANFVVTCKRQTRHLSSQPFWYLTLVTSLFYLYLPLCTLYRHPVVLIAHFAHCHHSIIITMSQNDTQCCMMWQYVHGYNIITDSVDWEPALPIMR